jgi:hypothetical protein
MTRPPIDPNWPNYAPEQHVLSLNADGSCWCSCGIWGYSRGTIGVGHRQIPESNILKFHLSHQHLRVIDIGGDKDAH